ncbi:DUF6279 family lipoprotein [Microbulbifer sp. OS29]|uniref:DUF6279 family lipoprotein n=1 Tax=Microbulbifer okhotskensis TaxID=2926617 RepID=A0A9X2EQI2_9GAMM|nr:DUF6279 family lipoprotein [Microbulbifer okhotskensis]MCO1333878.1 DUF6279 family lipoprotein [Microbulbifer okhotskensis]
MAQFRGNGTRLKWHFVFLFLVATFIGSCSSIQFAYNNVDYLIRWKLHDYVNLTQRQKQELQAALSSFFHWHRQTQLPRYADFLSQLANEVEQGQLETPQLAPVEKQLRQFIHAASSNAYDLLLPIAAQLTPHQIDQLQQNLRKKQRKMLEKWQRSPWKIQRRRDRQIRRESRRWLGTLTESQKQLIAAWVAQVEYNPLLRSEQQHLWQDAVIDLLRQKPPGYLDKLRDLLENPEQLWSDQYRKTQEERHQQARELGKQILSSTSPAQRHHLSKTLRDYAQDFRTLSSQ